MKLLENFRRRGDKMEGSVAHVDEVRNRNPAVCEFWPEAKVFSPVLCGGTCAQLLDLTNRD